MQVRGFPRVAAACAQGIAALPVRRHGLFRRLFGRDRATTFVASGHRTVKGNGVLIFILTWIHSIQCRLPDVEFSSRNRTPFDILDHALGKQKR